MSTAEPSGGMVPRWTIGDRMRKARIVAGMSTDDMARDIGRTRRTISNYESDSTSPPVLVLRQYALRTGVPLAWLQVGTIADEGGGGPSLPVTLGYTAGNPFGNTLGNPDLPALVAA